MAPLTWKQLNQSRRKPTGLRRIILQLLGA